MKKRGVSIMVGYVILIVIAIALSVLVYSYLKLYLPSERPECDRDISLAIDSAECISTNLYLNISNRGLFTVEGAFIRAGDVDRIAKDTLNSDDTLFGPEGLKPGEKWSVIYSDSDLSGEIELEIQPFIIENNEQVLCENAVITRRVTCTSIQGSLG